MPKKHQRVVQHFLELRRSRRLLQMVTSIIDNLNLQRAASTDQDTWDSPELRLKSQMQAWMSLNTNAIISTLLWSTLAIRNDTEFLIFINQQKSTAIINDTHIFAVAYTELLTVAVSLRLGGIISLESCVGGSFPLTAFSSINHWAKANCSLFKKPLLLISHKALNGKPEMHYDFILYITEEIQ